MKHWVVSRSVVSLTFLWRCPFMNPSIWQRLLDFFSYVYQSTLVCQRGPVSKAYLVYSTLKTLDIMKGLFMAAPQYYCLEILNLCEVGMAQVHLANFWAARPTWKEKKKDKEASLFIGVSLAYPVAKKRKTLHQSGMNATRSTDTTRLVPRLEY